MPQVLHQLCAIIVAFNPSRECLVSLALKLKDSNSDVVIIDNSPEQDDSLKSDDFSYIWMHGNKGIAEAQNVGIEYCLSKGYEYIIFFDQDSVIETDFIDKLLTSMIANSFEICAPVFFDEKKGFEYAITHINKNGTREKLFSEGQTQPFTTSVAISSGTLVNAKVFNLVGLMDSGLFIDYVDTEWCLRCYANNIMVNIIPDARMKHSIGDNSFHLFGFCVPVHSPTRRYYRVRNSFHLFRYQHVPKLLAMREIVFSFIHSGLLIATQKQKKNYIKSFIAAVRDGVLNVKGEKK